MKSTPLDIICMASSCRSWLYLSGFLSEAESERVNDRIRKYQDKHRQNVTREDMNRAKVVMENNEKDEEVKP